jgi:subtilisin family serine protease
MKKLIAIVVFFLAVNFATRAQTQFSPASKRFLYDYKQTQLGNHKAPQQPSSELIAQYGLYQKANQYYIGALLLVQPEQLNLGQLNKLGLRQIKSVGNIYAIRLPIENLEKLAAVEGVKLVDVGDSFSPDLHDLIKSTRADSAHKGLGGLNQSYTGKNVVVAIIDWGFDYTHPMFYDSTLTNYRVVRAWDQNKMSGPPPAGFDFGAAYESKEALLAAKEDTLYVFGPGSHGTHVAGIAGGSGGGTRHVGVALNSDLIFISLRRDAPSLIDAYLYIQKYAQSVNKPFVVNMSFGSHLGPHDGTSLENIGIDGIVGNGKIVVGSAGNNGNANFHLNHAFSNPSDTLKTIVNFTAMDNYFGQTLSMWGSANTQFSVRFKLLNSNNTIAFETPWYNSANNPVLTQKFRADNGDSLELRITATAAFVTNQKPNIRAEIGKKSSLRLLAEVVSETQCHLHIWNNVRLNNRYTNWGTALTSNFLGAKGGDINYGLGEPAGVGKSVLTVASYRSEVIRTNGVISFGQISAFTSRGPTVDERRKPDIAGPGQEVVSSVNSYDTNPKNVVSSKVFNGRTYEFEAYSGTSMSGPAVAGIVAMLLEKNPSLNHKQIKEIIQNTARLDIHTGNIAVDTGSLIWGSGKANVLAALRETDKYPFVKEIKPQNFSVYPNPSTGEAIFVASETSELKIFSSNGQLVYQNRFSQREAPYRIDLQFLNFGIYHFRFMVGNQVYNQKWVKVDR